MGAILVRFRWCGVIWAGLGLAGRPELSIGLCVELRVVHGLELK